MNSSQNLKDAQTKKVIQPKKFIVEKKIKKYSSFKVEFLNELSEINIICFRNNSEQVKLSSQDQKDEYISSYDSKFLQQYAIEQFLELVAREEQINFKNHFSCAGPDRDS